MQACSSAAIVRLVPLGLIAAALVACAPTPVTEVAPRPEQLLASAQKQAEAGQHAPAARIYEELASISPGDLHDRFLLRAAHEWLLANDSVRAGELLDLVSRTLPTEDFILRARIAAALALGANQPERALRELERIPEPLDRAVAPEVLALRGDALFALGHAEPGVRALLARERLLTDAADIRQNRLRIWNGLQRAAEAGADFTPPLSAGPELAGWLELGRVARATSRNPFSAPAVFAEWRSVHPTHPAGSVVAEEVLPAISAGLDYPAQIAAVLPLSGRLQAAGTAVRDGFLAAALQQGPAERPVVRVYDSAALGVNTAYRRALADGARFVVGPLSKEDVLAVANSGDIAVTTLALNLLPDGAVPPGLLFQFALDPEEEARQVARRVIADGRPVGVALLPNSEWGQRVYRAFDSELASLGGRLLAFRFYDPDARDFSEPITRLLLIDESRARYEQLARTLGTPLEFEARRREDARFVFIAGQPAQGRSLRPALRFHMAEDLPVYATSDIYAPDERANADLDGIIYPDMPWVISPDESASALRATLLEHWPARVRSRGRLYAFGFDAYRLIPLLKGDQATSLRDVPGMTGRLSVGDGGRVRRELDWARIVRGEPRSLEQPTLQAAGP